MEATALQPHLPGTSRTSNTASTSNAAQPSTLEMLGTQPTAAEQQRTSDLQEQFQQQARQDPAGFRSAMRAAFGDKASLAQIDQLLDLALAGKLPMPSNIQFVEAGSLGSGALGAYDANNGGSLYLDRSLLSDPTKLQSVFNEEMGHHLDALLGGADAAGDEGAVFSRTLEQGTLSQRELAALKSEDDHGVIQIGGRWVQVEFRQEGGGGSGGGGGDSGGASGGTDSSGGECGVDSGGGNTSGSQSDSDNDSGASDSGDTGGECSVGGNNDGGGSQSTGGSDDTDGNNGGHQNGESDSDRAGGRQENSTTAGGDEKTQAESASGTTQDADTEPAPEPEEKGFWSRALDAVQTGLDVAGFIPGLGAIPDLANAGIHLARGNKAEAAISAAAAIPLGGDAFKAGVMGVRAADRLNDGRRALDNAEDVVSYSRPSGFRSGKRDEVWDNAVEPSTGRVRDPLTGQFMSRSNDWDMGHKPGYEFHKHRDSAQQRGISRSEFLDEFNNTSHYRPELPSSNRSHRAEDRTDDYLGD